MFSRCLITVHLFDSRSLGGVKVETNWGNKHLGIGDTKLYFRQNIYFYRFHLL